jgi:hypothetical protein
MKSQSATKRPARHPTRRAPPRSHVLGRWRSRDPPLDVDLALYDSTWAPVFLSDAAGATMGTVRLTPVPITIS